MIKYRQALRATSVLWHSPFDFVSLNLMADAIALSWPVQAAYRKLLAERPVDELERLRALTKRPVDMRALELLPENTLGRRFVQFFDTRHNVKWGGHWMAVPQLLETFERDWVTHRLYKLHDVLHVVCEFDTDVAGEMGQQMFDSRNLREPYGYFVVAATPIVVLRYGHPIRTVREIIRGYRIGSKASNLFFAPFEEMWELDIDDVRARVGLIDRPSKN